MLTEAIASADEKSEDVLQRYNDKEIKLDEFIKEYKKVRTTYHLRMAKQERLNA